MIWMLATAWAQEAKESSEPKADPPAAEAETIDPEGSLVDSLGKSWNLGANPDPLEKWGENWTLSRYEDLLTARPTTTVLLPANNKISGGEGQVTPTLLIHCIGDYPSMMFHVRYPPEIELIDLEFAYTTTWVQLDDANLKKVMMQRSKDSQYLIFDKAQKWIPKILDAEQVRMRYTPFNHGPQVAIFDTSNISADSAKSALKCID